MQTGRSGTSRSYEYFTPFLVGVPQVTSADVVYNVTCMPKFAPIDKPYEPVNPNEVEVPDEPDNPDEPEGPDNPGNPDEPENPDNPNNTKEPDKTPTPDNTGVPGTPSSSTPSNTTNETSEYDADNPMYGTNQITTTTGSVGAALSHTADATPVVVPLVALLAATVLVVAGIKIRRL